MATCKYSLRGNSIQLRFSYGRGKILQIATGWSVEKEQHWNHNAQSIRGVLEHPEYRSYNTKLRGLSKFMLDEYDKFLNQEVVVTNDDLKLSFKNFKTPSQLQKEHSKDFESIWERFLEDKKTTRVKGKLASEETIKSFKNTFVVLKKLNQHRGIGISFRHINISFYNELVTFCEGLEYSLNYIGKIIKNLKTFLKYAERHYKVQLPDDYVPEDFVVLQEEADDIYLTNEELMILYHLDLNGRGVRHEKARDLFLIGAFTGLRVSDYSKLSEDNIRVYEGQRFFKVITKKTSAEVIIPISEIVESIIKRNNGLPKYLPDQSINQLIKIVGEDAGIDESVSVTKTIGGGKRTKRLMKFEMIKTHTARRSFCTNAYLGGMDSLSIMAVSGHTTETSFLKYIKVTKKEQAQRIANHPYFKSLNPNNFNSSND